jgi:glucitol/sorbitol PTS system EIIA component
MIMIKYDCTVISIGPLTQEFIAAGILVLFGADVPEELVEFCIVHDGTQLHANLIPGDLILIDDESFQILSVGEVANINLENLGHLILKFNGKTEPELPGDVCLEAKQVPDIQPGSRVLIREA